MNLAMIALTILLLLVTAGCFISLYRWRMRCQLQQLQKLIVQEVAQEKRTVSWLLERHGSEFLDREILELIQEFHHKGYFCLEDMHLAMVGDFNLSRASSDTLLRGATVSLSPKGHEHLQKMRRRKNQWKAFRARLARFFLHFRSQT
jgi:hypothetical protein